MKSKYLLYFIVALFIYSSCAKMEEKPYGFLSNENFYTSEENVRGGLIYAYEAMYDGNWYWPYFRFNEVAAQTCAVKFTDWRGDNLGLMSWQMTPEITYLRNFWQASYVCIFRANTVIDNAEEISFSDNTVRNQYIGEAKFLRAFNYFQLVKLYGEVPIYRDAKNPAEAFETPTSSLEECYDIIINDLKYAATNVPVFKIAGRADQIAAKALLTKVYMHLASSKEYGAPRYDWVSNANDMYDLAIKYGEETMNSSSHGMDASIFNTFPDNLCASEEKIFCFSTDYDGDNVGYINLNVLLMPFVGYYTDMYAKILFDT